MKALLLVDILNDFLPDGNLPIADGDKIIAPANRLIQHYKSKGWLIIAIQDWHPENHGSFASNNDAEPYTMGELDGLPQMMWTDHCVQDSVGAMFPPLLDIHLVDGIVQKGTNPLVDSYSGFFDNDKRGKTRLDLILKDAGVDEVEVCGLARDYCAGLTAIDAQELGYKTSLIYDATKPANMPEGSDTAMIQRLLESGITITHVESVVGE